MDLVSRRELSRDASIESLVDCRVSVSTSVAKDLVHDLEESPATRRPTIISVTTRVTGRRVHTVPYYHSS